MHTIGIIHCYFGKLPNYFGLWLLSVEYNPTIDFLLYTDQNLDRIPANLRYFKTSLREVEQRARKNMGFPEIVLPNPYKLCDFKPMYGEIFQEDLQEYDFWGHCDSDMLLGDLRFFFSEEALAKYDKLLPLGHLSLYRNTPEVNGRYRLEGSRFPLREVLSTPGNFAFDEWRGIYKIYEHNHFPFDKRMSNLGLIYALNRRFQLVSRSSSKYEKTSPDFPHQLFYWKEGKVSRAYYEDGQIKVDEFIYIHFLKRKFPDLDFPLSACKMLLCTPKGFILKNPEEKITIQEIKKLNPYYGKLYEKAERKWNKLLGRWKKKLGLSRGFVKPEKAR